tara:strand:+ start:3229 stop:5382 length:2154 start_codon:yes stop_codon:yes gene_type:complete
MKRTVQVYVTNADGNLELLDLFNDETISLTDTIQDVRDIAKVFTEFTQAFSVPASNVNNKIFRHFYNADISNGYDSRSLKNAEIQINGLPFKKGFITLEGVNMKNNKAESYRITFYGETVDLKKIIGDDELSSLDFDSALTETYSAANIQTLLTRDPNGQNIICPLITHSQRLYYNSTENNADVGNIYYKNSGQKHGVKFDNLKYAIRVHKIIEAIEAKYTEIDFTTDFFISSNTHYYNLFMWMHREKGTILEENPTYSTDITNFTPTVGPDYVQVLLGDTDKLTVLRKITDIDVTTVMSNTSIVYSVIVTHSEFGVVGELLNVSGNKTNVNIPLNRGNVTDGYLTVKVQGRKSVTFNTFTLRFDDATFGAPSSQSVSATTPAIVEQVDFNPKDQLPNMKIIDLLTGLFKMFNLTAFVQSDGKIYVDTLDEFYKDLESTDSPYNIDKFVDSNENTVDSALPYSEVNFKYEDTGTLLAVKHSELLSPGFQWGEERYDYIDAGGTTNFSGESYMVEPPFGHMKFERLIDLNDGTTNTVIQWGYSADDNFNEDSANGDYDAYIGKPVLFYPVYTSVSANPISIITTFNNNGTFNTNAEINTSINMPSNSVSFDYTTSRKNINFRNENNEYNIDVNGTTFGNPSQFTETLFQQFYSTYITQVFSKSNRIISLKAYLPIRILLHYTLADKFIYRGKKHQINSITTNLTTGESEIELLNIVIE